MLLSRPLFALFASLVEECCGLYYSQHDRELFASKLGAHARDQGFDAPLDFYYALRYDDPDGTARGLFVESLLVHETYLFRELRPLVELANLLVHVVAAQGRARVWSAACASGEEPFTLAMLLDQRGILDRVEIVATDLSAAIIDRAKQGRLPLRSRRDVQPPELAKYLEVGEQGISVAPRIRAAIQFSVMNLVAAPSPDWGVFDAIICRNVLIYFRDEVIVRVLDGVAAHLAPGGLLAVGVSESLMRFGTKLACVERGGAFLYQAAW